MVCPEWWELTHVAHCYPHLATSQSLSLNQATHCSLSRCCSMTSSSISQIFGFLLVLFTHTQPHHKYWHNCRIMWCGDGQYPPNASDGNLIFFTFLFRIFKTCFQDLFWHFEKKFYKKLFSKISFSGFLKPVSKVCKMSFDIFEKDFHILQEISFCPVGPLIHGASATPHQQLKHWNFHSRNLTCSYFLPRTYLHSCMR